MLDTNADCNIWLNHTRRTEASPKARSNRGSSAARSNKVSLTSKTQTLFTSLPSAACQHAASRLADKRRPLGRSVLSSAAFEAEGFARLVWCRRLAVEHGPEGYGLFHQLGVGAGALVAADPEVVFEADAHVAA